MSSHPDQPKTEPPISALEAEPVAPGAGNDTFGNLNEAETLHAPTRQTPLSPPPPRRRFPEIPGYEIEDVIGRGGMGVVYRARDLKLGRTVAVKTLQMANTGKEARQRIEHEARLLAQVQHPGVVQIFGFGTAVDPESPEPLPFIAMELVNGPNLDRFNDGNPLKPRQAAMIVYELARALSACHDRGIIHRDLKPGNVLMAGENEPKLTDFGLARATGAQSRMTRTGEVMGTPGFMAPEQASGAVKNIGPEADIYGLGAILYALLTGRPPFMAPDPMQTMIEVLTRPPVAPRTIQSKIPRDLETITLKCLEKKPRHRYESCKDLADDLRAFLSSKPVSAKPTPALRKATMWVRRHPAWTSLIGLAFSAVIVGIAGTAFHINSLQTELDRSERIIEEGRKFSKWWLDDFSKTLEGTGGVTWSRSVLADRTQTYLETLLNEAPQNNDLKSDLAYAFWRLADVQASIGGGNFGTNNPAQLNMERAEQIILTLKDRETPIARKVLAAVALHHAEVHLNKREYAEMEQRIEEVRGLIGQQETLPALDRLAFEGQICHLLFESHILRSDLEAAAKIWSELDEICKKVIANGERPGMSVAAIANFVFASEKLFEPQLRRKELATILDQAVSQLNAIREKHPLINVDTALAAIELRSGNTQYWLEDYKAALEAYQTAIEINGRLALRDSMNDNVPYNTALAWQYLGDTHSMLNDLTAAETAYGEAEKHFRKWSTASKSVLEIDPGWLMFHSSFGQLFVSQGKYDRAIQMFQAQIDGLQKLDKADSHVRRSTGDAMLALAQCKSLAANSRLPAADPNEDLEACDDAIAAARIAAEHFRKMESDGLMNDAARQQAAQAEALLKLMTEARDSIENVPGQTDF
jgi:serine/threonine protein kinase